MRQPFNIKIIGQSSEIRMGSPYYTCEFDLSELNLELPKNGWQDKFAWSNNDRYLVLIRWNLENNEPEFNFYIIDAKAQTFRVTSRICGLINNIKIKDNKILFNKFLLDKEKSKSGKLCCNMEEEDDIKK